MGWCVAETFTFLQDSVPSTGFWSCYFKVKYLHSVALKVSFVRKTDFWVSFLIRQINDALGFPTQIWRVGNDTQKSI